MLDAVIQYVEAVLDGTQESDNSVGRALNDMVSWINVLLDWALTLLCVKTGAVRAQDGSRPVWSNVEQQHAGLADGRLPLPNDQDPAAVEREALHGLCQQSEGGGQASTSRGALNISQVVPSQFFKIEDHITTTTILAIL